MFTVSNTIWLRNRIPLWMVPLPPLLTFSTDAICGDVGKLTIPVQRRTFGCRLAVLAEILFSALEKRVGQHSLAGNEWKQLASWRPPHLFGIWAKCIPSLENPVFAPDELIVMWYQVLIHHLLATHFHNQLITFSDIDPFMYIMFYPRFINYFLLHISIILSNRIPLLWASFLTV